jgi:hypothetical protein
VTELVGKRVGDLRLPEPVSERLEFDGQHPLIGLG